MVIKISIEINWAVVATCSLMYKRWMPGYSHSPTWLAAWCHRLAEKEYHGYHSDDYFKLVLQFAAAARMAQFTIALLDLPDTLPGNFKLFGPTSSRVRLLAIPQDHTWAEVYGVPGVRVRAPPHLLLEHRRDATSTGDKALRSSIRSPRW